jgi:hypothetical protein
LLTLLCALVAAAHAQAPQPAANPNPTVSNKETTIKRFFFTMGSAAQGTQLGKTAFIGSPTGGTEFTDALKDGGVLVGFDVWASPNDIRGIQPIFETAEKGRVRGQKHGACKGAPTTLEAKDGFAVAGINTNGLGGFEVLFMLIHHGGLALDSAGSYRSPWVGGKVGKASRLVPSQKPVIGIYGATTGSLDRLGLLFYDRR